MLDKEMAKRGRRINVYVQTNTSNEPQKGGATPESVMLHSCFDLLKWNEKVFAFKFLTYSTAATCTLAYGTLLSCWLSTRRTLYRRGL